MPVDEIRIPVPAESEEDAARLVQRFRERMTSSARSSCSLGNLLQAPDEAGRG